jgi:hypothetical protein
MRFAGLGALDEADQALVQASAWTKCAQTKYNLLMSFFLLQSLIGYEATLKAVQQKDCLFAELLFRLLNTFLKIFYVRRLEIVLSL